MMPLVLCLIIAIALALCVLEILSTGAAYALMVLAIGFIMLFNAIHHAHKRPRPHRRPRK